MTSQKFRVITNPQLATYLIYNGYKPINKPIGKPVQSKHYAWEFEETRDLALMVQAWFIRNYKSEIVKGITGHENSV